MPRVVTVVGWVGSLWGDQRDYLVCANCDREFDWTIDEKFCSCGGEIEAHIPHSEELALRWQMFLHCWFPYRLYTFLPSGGFGPAKWTPPKRGPLRRLMCLRSHD